MVERISDDSLRLSEDAVKNLKVERVVRGEFPEQLLVMGKISVPEDRVAVVPARVAGRTDSVYVTSGEVVAAGQPLASIFSADFSIAREEYLQAYRQQSTGTDSESWHLFELSKRKLAALGVSPVDIAKWETAAADEHRVENLIVRAPRAGAVLGKNAIIGNIVNVGDTLFMIGDLNKVWFAGDLYPEDLPKVHKDQEVIIDPGNGTPSLHGKVSFISPVIDPSSRTIKIRALIENPHSQLRADMYVQGSVVLRKQVALLASKNILVRAKNSIFCFKRMAGNVFKKIVVNVAAENSDTIAVSDGLSEGDEVVTEGGLLLDGALNSEGQ
jgi:Cu(I)/Ag(I) efflux system membrane fusion protein